MPLLDHFHPPLSRTHPWRGFHGAWAAAMARWLNAGVLPTGYYAVPFLDRDGLIEIDIATMQLPDKPTETSVTHPWTPPAPDLAIAVEWPSTEDVRVVVFADDGDPRLAAAIELVSPRNKDRPQSRQAFVAKCAEHLRQGCGLVIIDVVTCRRANLHAELMAALGSADGVKNTTLSAVAYRAIGREEQGQLLAWTVSLALGQALPTIPLWLGMDQAVPLDLEASYVATCEDLRIRQAG